MSDLITFAGDLFILKNIMMALDEHNLIVGYHVNCVIGE